MKTNAQETEQQLWGAGMGKADRVYDDGQKHNF